jgi:hypothetical protein
MILEIMPRKVNDDSTWLRKHRGNVTSQCGEDGIIAKVFEIIKQHGKVCVEFGAWDGMKHSNTFALIKQRGWSGYLIESNAEKFKALQDTYRGHPNVELINRFVRLDKGDGTIDEILAEHKCPAEIDLLSIDIDGNDYYVWESMTEPTAKVVVIEFNPTVPNDVIFVQDRSFDVNQGCSLLALTVLAREKGYELVCATPLNAIFVRIEYFALFNIEDNSIDAMYQPGMNGRIFHGYDGTIHMVGMPRLGWHEVHLTSENFQVLPPNLRVFKDAQE